MKFLHLGDLHLGKSVNEISMLPDQKDILAKILGIADSEEVSAVLVSGDIYDRPVPPEEAVRLLDWFMGELAARHIPLLMISGNHDSDERLNFGAALFRPAGVYIAGKYEGALPEVTLADACGPVHFYMLPFVKASLVAHYYPEEDCSTYDAAVRTAIRMAHVDPAARNVLLCHQFVVSGGRAAETAGSETAAVNVGTVEQVDAAAFADFDYTALGHIHSPQKIGRECIRYAGSPLKYSLSEISRPKSAAVVELGAKGELSVQLHPLRPLHEMRHLRGPFARLLETAVREKACGEAEDYMYVTLTDEHPVLEAQPQLAFYYPNIMKLDYDNSHTRAAGADPAAPDPERSFTELLLSFYREMNGGEPGDEELRLLRRAALEAGIKGAEDTEAEL